MMPLPSVLSDSDRRRMPRRFFRKFSIKRQRVHDQWYMAPFRHLLDDNNYWSIRRRTVVPAFALGIFIGFLPFPAHLLLTALLALALRVNIPVALITTLFSNPLTMPAIFYLCYQVGQEILGLPPQPFDFELSLDWLTHSFTQIWQPLLLGCILIGSIASLIGFVALDLLWRASLADYLAKRRAKKPSSDNNDA